MATANSLIIVESPTKAKTITRFLKNGYKIIATKGHVRDLPKKRFGVKVTEGRQIKFEPQYAIIPEKKATVTQLKQEVKRSKRVILATDPDREGEAIAWHVAEALGLKEKDGKMGRIVFHEITAPAIKEALQKSRSVNLDLVDAQQARRVLDRIVGYKLSPLIWQKVRSGLSAGRVQSVAVRLVVEREREIEKFQGRSFYRIWAVFQTDKKEEFAAELTKINQKPVEKKETHQLFAGSYKVATTIWDSLAEAEKIILSLIGKPRVDKVLEKEVKRHPLPPFTTSKLQQESSRRFGWSSRLTMQVAQSLYEHGLITYHRTDSTNLSDVFLDSSRRLIGEKYGHDYLPEKAVHYRTHSRLAQEAHEAIRPTDPARETIPKSDHRQQQLYNLIWQRAVASQMAAARLSTTKVGVVDGDKLFSANGTRVVFDGFSRAYPIIFSEVTLPPLREKEVLSFGDLGITTHETAPPPRYSEASLISALEKEGIGRPSTYAPIISLIQSRYYVEKEEGRFKPTNLGIAVNDLLVQNFPDILSLPFTAGMEKELDEIAAGERGWQKTVGDFWPPFIKKIEEAKTNSGRVKIETESLHEKCPQCQEGDLIIRVGRFGKFVACSRYPECKYTRPLINDAGFTCPQCGAKVVIRRTKRGKKFFGCSGWPGCKWASWKKPKSNA